MALCLLLASLASAQALRPVPLVRPAAAPLPRLTPLGRPEHGFHRWLLPLRPLLSESPDRAPRALDGYFDGLRAGLAVSAAVLAPTEVRGLGHADYWHHHYELRRDHAKRLASGLESLSRRQSRRWTRSRSLETRAAELAREARAAAAELEAGTLDLRTRARALREAAEALERDAPEPGALALAVQRAERALRDDAPLLDLESLLNGPLTAALERLASQLAAAAVRPGTGDAHLWAGEVAAQDRDLARLSLRLAALEAPPVPGGDAGRGLLDGLLPAAEALAWRTGGRGHADYWRRHWEVRKAAANGAAAALESALAGLPAGFVRHELGQLALDLRAAPQAAPSEEKDASWWVRTTELQDALFGRVAGRLRALRAFLGAED